jgi:hypothetical protein|nr:MAG TPA: hypothetical protein [Caudoviricetes sp.]
MKKINASKVTSVKSIETRFSYDRENKGKNIWRQLDLSIVDCLPNQEPKLLCNFYILERYKKETDKFQIVLHEISYENERLPLSAADFYPINNHLEYEVLSEDREIVLFEESRSNHLERLCRLPHIHEIWNIIDSLPWDTMILNKFLDNFDFLDKNLVLMLVSQLKDAMGMFFKTNYHNNIDRRCVWEIIQYCGLEYATKYLKFIEKGE